MVGHFGDSVLGQMDLRSEGVLLFSGSLVLARFPTGNRSGISKNEHKERNKIRGEMNRYCSLQKGLHHSVEEHVLLQSEGLIFEAR